MVYICVFICELVSIQINTKEIYAKLKLNIIKENKTFLNTLRGFSAIQVYSIVIITVVT